MTSDERFAFRVLSLPVAAVGVAYIVSLATDFDFLQTSSVALLGSVFVIVVFMVGMLIQIASMNSRELDTELKEARAERKSNPSNPSTAWDVARLKLEKYLDRNLQHVRAIFWATVVSMFGGFCIIAYGLTKGFASPENFPVAVVAAASGVLVEFLAGSLLLVFRSTMSQAKDYVVVLDRINAVGMSVAILESIDKDDVKNQSRAELASALLDLYRVADK